MPDRVQEIPAAGTRGSMRAWWWCTAAFAIAFVAIRLASAGFPLFWDEWISIFFARLPVTKLWSDWIVNESNPPLYYTLLKGWLDLFGFSPESARMLSVAGGVLGAVVLSLCSHRIFGFWGALATYVIFALSTQDVFYSLFVRAYIFVLLAFAISLLGMLILLESGASPKQRRGGLILYAAGALAAIYLHTTMLLWPVAASLVAGAFMLLDRSARGLLPGWIAANLAVAALAGWWVWITFRQVAGGAQWVVWMPPMTAHEYVSNLRQSILFLRGNSGLFKPASYLLAALVFLPLLKRDRTAILLCGLLLASIAVFFAAQLIKPIIYQKTIWWMTGLTAILVSGVIARLPWLPLRLLSLASLGGLLLADLIVARPGFATHDWPALVRYASGHPGSTVVMMDKQAGIIFNEACRAQFGRPCPVRSAVVLREPGVRSWSDDYSGRLHMWRPGQPAPVSGPAILLHDGLQPRQWAVFPGKETPFGALRATGPAPLQELVQPR